MGSQRTPVLAPFANDIIAICGCVWISLGVLFLVLEELIRLAEFKVTQGLLTTR